MSETINYSTTYKGFLTLPTTRIVMNHYDNDPYKAALGILHNTGKFTKDEIFELYVNTSYFGDGYYCVGDASEGYFEKKPKDMNLYECTLLAGIPNAPSVYAPTKNPELAKQRQAQVLKKMVKYKYLSKEQAENILK